MYVNRNKFFFYLSIHQKNVPISMHSASSALVYRMQMPSAVTGSLPNIRNSEGIERPTRGTHNTEQPQIRRNVKQPTGRTHDTKHSTDSTQPKATPYDHLERSNDAADYSDHQRGKPHRFHSTREAKEKWSQNQEPRIAAQDNEIAWSYPCTPTSMIQNEYK